MLQVSVAITIEYDFAPDQRREHRRDSQANQNGGDHPIEEEEEERPMSVSETF